MGDPPRPQDAESERIPPHVRPPRSKRRMLGDLLTLVIVLAPLAAASLGFSHAYSQWKKPPFPSNGLSDCPPLPSVQATAEKTAAGRETRAAQKPVTEQATVTDELDIHTSPRPYSFTTTEVVTVPEENKLALALMLQPGSPAARNAAACLFDGSVDGVPQLTSVTHGMATFKDSGTFPLPYTWQPAVHPRGIQLRFYPELVCNSYPFSDWAGTTLIVSIHSDTGLHSVAPQPDSVSGATWVWRSPVRGCGKLPHVSVTVPTDLAGYFSSIVSAGAGGSTLPDALGWSDPILTGLIALWLTLRIPSAPGRRPALGLVLLALLGILPAAINLSLSQGVLRGPAELIAVYSVALGLIVMLKAAEHPKETVTAADCGDPCSPASRRPAPSRRARLVAPGAGACAAAAILICAYQYPVWFPGAGILLIAVAAVLLFAVGVAALSLPRAVDIAEPRLSLPEWASVRKVRDLILQWTGVAAFVAIAYTAGDWLQLGSVQLVVSSEFSVLRYPLAALAQVLVPVALVLPLSVTGNPTRRVTAAAAFGLAMAANQPDLLVGGGWGLPLGTALMAVIACALVRDDDPAAAPRPGAGAKAALAVKTAALLAIIPVGYFSFTTIAGLSESSTSVFVVSSIVSQFTGWLVIGVFYGMLSSRLPGRVGPFKALILAGAWFAVAIVVSIADNGLHFPAGRAWIFAGLQFSLFLIAFSVVWDAISFKKSTLPETIKDLRAAYHLEQAQAVALYAIPVLLALVAVVQQVASGSGSDFVTSILNGASAAFGGR
jgi:hypothetical protein